MDNQFSEPEEKVENINLVHPYWCDEKVEMVKQKKEAEKKIQTLNQENEMLIKKMNELNKAFQAHQELYSDMRNFYKDLQNELNEARARIKELEEENKESELSAGVTNALTKILTNRQVNSLIQKSDQKCAVKLLGKKIERSEKEKKVKRAKTAEEFYIMEKWASAVTSDDYNTFRRKTKEEWMDLPEEKRHFYEKLARLDREREKNEKEGKKINRTLVIKNYENNINIK